MRISTLTTLTVLALMATTGSAAAQFRDYSQAAGDQYHQPSRAVQAAKRKLCTSHRRFTVSLGRGVVRARVTLNGRRLRPVRRHRVLTVVVDLRGHRAGAGVLRLRLTTRHGRHIRQTRRYALCQKTRKPKTVIVTTHRASAIAPPAGGLPGGAVVALLGAGLIAAASLGAAASRLVRARLGRSKDA